MSTGNGRMTWWSPQRRVHIVCALSRWPASCLTCDVASLVLRSQRLTNCRAFSHAYTQRKGRWLDERGEEREGERCPPSDHERINIGV